MEDKCPCCGESLIYANLGGGVVDTYCEECGWPDEVLEASPACEICGAPGVGTCGDAWRCEEHFTNPTHDEGEDK